MSRGPSAPREWLREVPWLQELPRAARDTVLAHAYASFHRRGEPIARLGDPPRSWIGVAEGLLKVSTVDPEGRGVIVTGVPRGCWIGEGGVVRSEPRRYDIVAVRESSLVHIPSATFRRLLDTSVEFRHIVLAQLHGRVSQFLAMLEIDRLADPVARVARTLATVFEPAAQARAGVALPLSQGELAELVGVSRQCVSAALGQLETQGLLHTKHRGVVLQDVAGLRNYRARTVRARRFSARSSTPGS